MLASARSRISHWNPQLMREIKGRWKGRNIGIAVTISLVTQLLMVLFQQGRIPSMEGKTHRYCVGKPPSEQVSPSQFHNPPNNFCAPDGNGNLTINWELWWLDLFTLLTVSAIIVLLVAGTYLLSENLAKEEKTGTLSFLRLTPRSVGNILVGKMLGVPILVYLVILLALPLHLVAGLSAEIPISLIAGFYLVTIASCGFFYTIALLYGLVTASLGTSQSQPSLASGCLSLFLLFVTSAGLTNGLVTNTIFDWLALFYPGKILPFLVGETPHSLSTIGYFHRQEVVELRWYDLPIWQNASSAIALLILNYAWWSYWAWQGLQRRFRNPKATLLNKPQSYWMSGSLTVSLLGFVYSDVSDGVSMNHFAIWFAMEVVVVLLLIAGLSPHRETLQDWAQYRYQNNDPSTRNLVVDLIKGENSPATGAIALNLVCKLLIVIPTLVLFPISSDRWAILASLFLASSTLLIYAGIVQWMLLMKTPKRGLFAGLTVSGIMVISPTVGVMLGLPASVSLALLPIPSIQGLTATGIFFNLLAQWVVIIGCHIQLTRQLKKAGESTTKALLSESKRIREV